MSQEIVARELTRITGVGYAADVPPQRHSAKKDHIWYVQIFDPKAAKDTSFLDSAWETKDGTIWMQSRSLGDTVDWIESAYGVDEAVASLDLDYTGFSTRNPTSYFAKKFPLVWERIKKYEEVAGQFAKEKKVHVEVRAIGSKGILSFVLIAKLPRKRYSEKLLSEEVERTVDAMKEAWKEIMKI